MAKSTITAEYNCTMQELYSTGNTIYDNLETEKNLFKDYKSKYDQTFIDALRKKITDAKGMPDDEARVAKHQQFKEQMKPLAKVCTDLYQDLKGYIFDGFPESERAGMYDAAGQTNIENALKENWEFVVGLNTQMKKFVVTYATELGLGFMPAGFAAKITTASDKFDVAYGKFKQSRQTGVDTDALIAANNEINKDIAAVNADGQRVFKNDVSKQKLFTFSVVKSIVSPPGSASLKLLVKDEVTDLAMADVDVIIKAAGGVALTGKTNAAGEVEFKNVDPASYNCTFKKTGYIDLNMVKEVNTGTAARKEVFMEAAV